jgi:hypothetical protein
MCITSAIPMPIECSLLVILELVVYISSQENIRGTTLYHKNLIHAALYWFVHLHVYMNFRLLIRAIRMKIMHYDIGTH